jgi:iron complex transport system substrate-binding protein
VPRYARNDVERIASLLPSTTEIACALGFREALVGRSHECDYPAGVAALPPLTEPKLDPGAAAREIDGRVRFLVSEGLSVYRVDAALLRTLEPTVILTQDHCEVCAASLGDLETALESWLGDRPRVVSLEPRSLGDVFASFQQVADALGAPERGHSLAAKLSQRLSELAERAQAQPDRPRVACIEWIDPLMAAGNWMPELVALAGATHLFGTLGEHSPWLDWETLRAADPDAIVVLPCGFDLARTRAELAPLVSQPGFEALRAVQAGRVYLTDGHRYFNRPGPRLIESLEILCEVLHPEVFAPRHEGRRWCAL